MKLSFVALLATLALLLALAAPVAADTPANCTYGGYIGQWTYFIGPPATPGETSLNCSGVIEYVRTYSLKLSYPNIAIDSTGAQGNWTLIYNQGVEVWIGGRVYFAFSDYTATESLCAQTKGGWAHDMQGDNWTCFYAKQTTTAAAKSSALFTLPAPTLADESTRLFSSARASDPARLNRPYKTDLVYLAKVNEAAKGWFTTKHYPEHEAAGRTIGEMERRRGSVSHRAGAPSPLQQLHANDKQCTKPTLAPSAIPDAWDWRNVSGVNFVSPVRNQGSCGSCYSFGSAAMMEARIRIASNNEQQPILSTQDIVSCSNYAQGCEGGFPYLIAGKFGKDFGLLEEACYPYVGVDSQCEPNPQPGCNSQRWKTQEYYYIGGYYGQSTVQLMQEEIMANGPIAVSFQVYSDFEAYSGGVYSHQFAREAGLEDSYNPFELTNHVVSIVGWGVTDDALAIPYWIVKNSWGPAWGENGFFRILRASSEAGGECAIESITVSAIPILH